MKKEDNYALSRINFLSSATYNVQSYSCLTDFFFFFLSSSTFFAVIFVAFVHKLMIQI